MLHACPHGILLTCRCGRCVAWQACVCVVHWLSQAAMAHLLCGSSRSAGLLRAMYTPACFGHSAHKWAQAYGVILLFRQPEVPVRA